jgi:hypothetical protein
MQPILGFYNDINDTLFKSLAYRFIMGCTIFWYLYVVLMRISNSRDLYYIHLYISIENSSSLADF